MDIAKPIGSEITSVGFSVLLDDEVRNLSVKQITNPQVFDNLGHPISNGLYDLSLGAFLRNICGTCGLDERSGCPGHQGHIELPVPVYNPLFFNQMYNFLRGTCVFCYKLKLNATEKHLYQSQLILLQYGLILEAFELENIRGDLDNSADATELEDDEADEGEVENSETIFKREAFVSKVLSTVDTKQGRVTTSAVQEARKKVVKTFYARLGSRGRCENCKMYSPGYRKDGVVKIFNKPLTDKQISLNRVTQLKSVENIEPTDAWNTSKYILSSEIKTLLTKVFEVEKSLLNQIFGTSHATANMFFRSTLVVPPTRFRLPSKLGEAVHENPLNELLSKVLKTCMTIKAVNSDILGARAKDSGVTVDTKKALFARLMNAFVTLQNDVNVFVDSTKNSGSASGLASQIPGVKQALEKKEGLFRKHMMGKRVNYAARSVISPDPMLETNQVGVPPVFAKKLSFPEPVTPHNVKELAKMVLNGADKWPGALQVQQEDGRLISLVGMPLEQRKAIADQLLTPSMGAGGAGGTAVATLGTKKVYRHLKNGDMVLMNRQPSLHKASIMGHRVKVLPGEKTLRIHYANTGAYNADFDGDEMNMHFPQSQMGQAEAKIIAATDAQYLTPTAGAPVRGLIQDHISAGVWVTNKDTFYTREQMQGFVYGCLRPEEGETVSKKILTMPPTIWKPKPLWTGKQLISTVLLNLTPKGMPGLNLDSRNKIKNEYWGANSQENSVIFRNGELLCGILDKSQYGAAKYGFVHAVHELYGAQIAGRLLSVLGRLFTLYIQGAAFTCGMEDICLTKSGNTTRAGILSSAGSVGFDTAKEVAAVDKDVSGDDPELLRRLEEIARDDTKLAFLDSAYQRSVEKITSQVISNVIPKGAYKKFPHNAMQSMALSGAKGSAVNVAQIMCLLGQQSLEGRRVPLMVSGKSLPSFKRYETAARAGGYIADRFYSGVKPQEYYFHCMAGREGLIDTAVKTARSGYLQRCLTKQLEGISVAYDNTVRDSDGTLVQFLYGGDSVDTTKESYLQQFEFCWANKDALKTRYDPASLADVVDIEKVAKYSRKVKKHEKKLSKSSAAVTDMDLYKYDPTISKFNPARDVGAVSSTFQESVQEFLHSHKKNKKSAVDESFEALMQLKYMRSLVDPGESVGIIAAESVGEPSTQMTLNTFHFAGHGAANVTLGIPRLREIVMTASASIKTPQMYLPVLSDVPDDSATIFAKSLTKITFSELVDFVEVTETTAGQGEGRSYEIAVKFFDSKDYGEEYNVEEEELAQCCQTSFLARLEAVLKKELSKQGKKAKGIERAEPKAVKATKQKKSDDMDADDAKMSSRTKQAVSYEAEEAEEDEEEEEEAENDDDEIDEVKEAKETAEESDDDVEMKASGNDIKMSAVTGSNYVTQFSFASKENTCTVYVQLPADTEKILMVDLVEDVCRDVIIREVPKLGRCFFQKEGAREMITEGVNFRAMFDEDEIIDVNGIRCNDVAAVLKTYGVEAARNTIVSEINKVFATYAISVSSRHLDLIADYMTREGSYLAFNRQGIDSATSYFKKMSYETTCQFLTKAVLENGKENLDSPSAKIVVGNLAGFGTGAFDVLTKMPIQAA